MYRIAFIESRIGMMGRIRLIAIERAKLFYMKIGFTEDEDDSRNLELSPTAAQRFLQRQRNRRRSDRQ